MLCCEVAVLKSTANPNIDKAVSLLITYEASARDKYENAKKSNARATQTNRIITKILIRKSITLFLIS